MTTLITRKRMLSAARHDRKPEVRDRESRMRRRELDLLSQGGFLFCDQQLLEHCFDRIEYRPCMR